MRSVVPLASALVIDTHGRRVAVRVVARAVDRLVVVAVPDERDVGTIDRGQVGRGPLGHVRSLVWSAPPGRGYELVGAVAVVVGVDRDAGGDDLVDPVQHVGAEGELGGG